MGKSELVGRASEEMRETDSTDSYTQTPVLEEGTERVYI